jgi:membrane-bound ClpP family serine protease
MNLKFFTTLVQVLSVFCALLLFLAVFRAPREYYWPLRIVVFVGALLVIVKNKKHLHWILLFGVIAILFNPIFPIYLYKKLNWVPLDILTGILFLIEAILNRPKKVKPIHISKNQVKKYERDRII